MAFKLVRFMYHSGKEENYLLSEEDYTRWKSCFKSGEQFEAITKGQEIGINPLYIARYAWYDGVIEDYQKEFVVSEEQVNQMNAMREKLMKSKQEKKEKELPFPDADKEDWNLILVECKCGETRMYKAPEVRKTDVCNSCKALVRLDASKGVRSTDYGPAFLYTNKYFVPSIDK